MLPPFLPRLTFDPSKLNVALLQDSYKTYNYQCKEDPLNRFCGRVGFQHGANGINGAWTLVWLNVGECEGNVALSPPTTGSNSTALERSGLSGFIQDGYDLCGW